MIEFDMLKCIRCGECVTVCPFGVLELKEGELAIGDQRSHLCIDCYHCAAVCRQDAISPAGSVKMDRQESPLPETSLETLIKWRRSVRKFDGTQVDPDLIRHVLHCTQWAPSAKNQHPAKWIVVTGRDKTGSVMEQVLDYVRETGNEELVLEEYERGNNIATFDAPCLLFVYADAAAINPFADCVIAMTMAALMFQERGIVSCWGGYMNRIANKHQPIREFLGIPQGCQVYGVLGLGHTQAVHYTYLPFRKEAEITWVQATCPGESIRKGGER